MHTQVVHSTRKSEINSASSPQPNKYTWVGPKANLYLYWTKRLHTVAAHCGSVAARVYMVVRK